MSVNVLISSLLSWCDVLFIHEHWLFAGQVDVLASFNLNYLATGIFGFDDSTILDGELLGGCGILWCKKLNALVTVLPTDFRWVCTINPLTATIRGSGYNYL